VKFRQNFLLAKHYRFVIILAFLQRGLGPRLVTAAAMKWMKWIGRSLVERAAATALLDLHRRRARGQQNAAQLSATVGQSNL